MRTVLLLLFSVALFFMASVAQARQNPPPTRTPSPSTAAQDAAVEPGIDLHDQGIRTIQELLGHRDVSTTMIHTHVLNQGCRGVRSPLDQLGPAPVRGRT